MWRGRRRRWKQRDQALLALLLLSAGTGATDVFAFAVLGGVFTSVMTGNLVLLGLGAGRGEPLTTVRPALAIVAFVVGLYLVARWLRDLEVAGAWPWPRRALVALDVVLVVFAAVFVAWFATGSTPRPLLREAMVTLLAGAMGLQSATVNKLAIPGGATTYLTGTLTRLVDDLVTRRKPSVVRRRQVGELVALLCGAVVASVLLVVAPVLVPAVPLVVTLTASVLARRMAPRGDEPEPGR
ncbi:YoaK family protein [Thermasporomyces composti]|uniref:Uncharacterized membrane protein YoaK (UPF0700 family) n=1 Tax=Thermasporomyces composti TaxID=696763 RepID=A0A3D9VGA9_THECX|nr:YoaK family protein [Thermasporomyces composti]REF37224.1 uncharacterized membrane protein YoaK (UPF0700 family) [Thermasporomyces composti]